MIRIVHFQFGKDPEIKMVENNLKTFQELVRSRAEYGLIEHVYLEKGFVLVCHEEGTILDLPGITVILMKDRTLKIKGDFFITRQDFNEDGELEFISLSEKHAEMIKRVYSQTKVLDPQR